MGYTLARQWIELSTPLRALALHLTRTRAQIENYLDILLGNLHRTRRATLPELLEKAGVSREDFARLTPEEQIDLVTTNQVTHLDDVIAALDVIFQERYGWPPGTVENITLWHLFLALEHAMQYDDPSKPSIWKITK